MIIVEAAELWPFETRWKETIFVSSVELARIIFRTIQNRWNERILL